MGFFDFMKTPSSATSYSSTGDSTTPGSSPGEAMAKATVRNCQHEAKAVHFSYTGGVTAGGQTIDFAMVKSFTIHRDFVTNFADEITVEAIIDTRKYFDYVVKNQDHLEVFIKRRQMAENSVLFVAGGENTTKKYKAILLDAPTQGLGAGNSGENQVTDPEQTITIAKFQLIEETTYDLRFYRWQGLMQNTEPLEALAMILAGTSLNYGQAMLNKAEADNKTPGYIVIPNGTYIKDMAHYIQQQYGIYNFGIGSYHFNDAWYIYPLFNNNRFDKEDVKLSISVVDKKHDPYKMPRTYIVNNYIVTMITTEDSSIVNQSSADQLQSGTGIQIVNTTGNSDENLQKEGRNDNQVKVDGAKAVDTFNVIQRKDGISNVQVVQGETSNTAALVSSVAGNAGSYLSIKWEFANPDLLVPGMPVKVVYLDNGLKTMYGTLHEYIAGYARAQNQFGDVPYICNVMMRIYVTDRPTVAQ